MAGNCCERSSVPALLLLALVPVAVQSTTPPATGSLSGAVTDLDRGALPGVTVTADNGTVKRTEVTNSDGRFAFAGPPVFETPVWDDHCRVATRSGQEYGLKIARLTVTR